MARKYSFCVCVFSPKIAKYLVVLTNGLRGNDLLHKGRNIPIERDCELGIDIKQLKSKKQIVKLRTRNKTNQNSVLSRGNNWC